MNTAKQNQECAAAHPIDQSRKQTGELLRVRDLPEDQAFVLVQDSQDLHATLESIGKLDELDGIGCLFVEVLDGDYGSVFAVERSIPYLSAIMCQLQ